MAYRWHYQDSTGAPAPGPDAPEFDDQEAAEEWLGAEWADLLDGGIDQVVLLDGDTEVYGPMSLHPPAD